MQTIYSNTEHVPASRQHFVLNKASFIGTLGTKKVAVTIKQALRLLNKLEITYLENLLDTKGQ